MRKSYFIELILLFLKIVAYSGLAVFLYSNYIGPEGIADVLRVENPAKEGLEMIGILIPNYVLIWTLATVILELIGNVYSLLTNQNYRFDNKYLTKKEFRAWELERFKEKLESYKK